MDMPLYHYTSIETFYNMFEHSIERDKETNKSYVKLRATNIEYLNDITERMLFTEALFSKVNTYATSLGTPLNDDQKTKFNLLCTKNIYIISLSELQDDLNMWRGYAGNGVGVNIGFDFSKIDPFYYIDKFDFKLEHIYSPKKCIYSQPDEYKIDDSLVQEIYTYLSSESKGFSDVKIMRDILELAPLVKHNDYSCEKEWRFSIFSCNIPKFTFSNGLFKPYFEFEIPITAIFAITIGPCIKEDYMIKSLINFIKVKIGYDTELRFSKIPYRR